MISKKLQEKGLICFEEITDYSIITDSQLREKLNKRKSSSATSGDNNAPTKKVKFNEDVIAINVDKIDKKLKKKKKKKTPSPSPTSPKSNSTSRITMASTTATNSNSDELDDDTEELEKKMTAWSDMMLPKSLLRGLYEKGFLEPTPIQKLVIPEAIKNKSNIIGTAQTGSGKTLAFGLPILAHLIDASTSQQEHQTQQQKKQQQQRLQALILTPTRELAIQIKDHMQACSRHTHVKIAVLVGGISQAKQERLLARKPEIVVATPGRLVQFVDEGNEYLTEGLARVRYFVIDEADRMIETGHFAEMDKILALVNSDEKCKQKRENFLFSATLITRFGGKFDEAAAKAEKSAKQTERERRALLNSLVDKIKMVKEPKVFDLTTRTVLAESLVESKIMCQRDEKDFYLYYFMCKYAGRTLVFANSIDCVRRLSNLFRLLGARAPLHLHANLNQKQRLKNLEKFHAEENSLLIASDVASRGLDIPGVKYVIHYQIPRSAEIYVHRSGRTARLSSQGLSVMLVSPDETNLYNKLIKTFKNEKEIRDYPVERNYFNECRARVNLARKINELERRLNKTASESNWYRKHAKMLDVELDDEIVKETSVDVDETSRERQRLKHMKAELKRQLEKTTVYPKSMSRKYLSNESIERVKSMNETKQNAINELRNSLKKSNKFFKKLLHSK